MVLEGSEVEHLVILSVVGGSQATFSTATGQAAIHPGPGVIAAESHSERLHGARLVHSEGLVGQLPNSGAHFLDHGVAEVAVASHGGLQNRYHQGPHLG